MACVEAMLWPCWPTLAHVWAILGLCWSMLGPCWQGRDKITDKTKRPFRLGKSAILDLQYVDLVGAMLLFAGAMLGPSWPMLAYLGPMLVEVGVLYSLH